MKLTDLPQSDQKMIIRYCEELDNITYIDSKGATVLTLASVLARIESHAISLLLNSEYLGDFRRRVNAMLAQDIRGVGKNMPKAIELQLAIYVDKCEDISAKLDMLHSLFVIVEEVDTIEL